MIIPQKIVIAGAGIIGNSIAYYLTRNHPEMLYKYGGKFTVTVIDPVGLCPGASSKAGGLLAQKWRDGTEQVRGVRFVVSTNLIYSLFMYCVLVLLQTW